MEFSFDLGSYDDMRAHAEAIYAALAAGRMPSDGAWPDEDVRSVPVPARHGRTPLARIVLFHRPSATVAG